MSIAVNFRIFRFPRNVVASTFRVRLLLLAILLSFVVTAGGCAFFLGDDALRQPLSARPEPLPESEAQAEITATEPATPSSDANETVLVAEAPEVETKASAPPNDAVATLNDDPVSLLPSFSLDLPNDDAFFFDESAFDILDEDVTDSSFFSDLPSADRTLIATIQFDRGSSALNARDQEILHQVVLLQSQRGGRLYVVGHASSYTDDMPMDRHQQVNLAISAKRAKRVADALYRLGAQSNSIETDAASDASPIYYEIMPAGEAGNRRAEIYIEP